MTESKVYDGLLARLTRIESRVVQIMLHLGLDPYKKMYDSLADSEQKRSTTGAERTNIHTSYTR